ncbi:hypothetical protein [Paenibacillus lentus]|uniref:Uncharacterized protein n=1 Tax=Paenibacillus lentus TaxID=1338368 RepID=A0A3Q8S3P8_9BACL|nr:hypothetical protein [Paenibacillus lentus]AZK45312.1 hypothetical protein EIM92_03090 [Paenibacillus lentus]
MASYQTREFKKKVTMTYEQAKMARDAQTNMYEHGIVKPNSNSLISGLGTSASILTLFFTLSKAAVIATGLTTLLFSASPNEKEVLKDMVQTGLREFNKIIKLFEDNPSYKMVEVELPFIEYKQHGELLAQFFTGAGNVIRINTGKGWIVL